MHHTEGTPSCHRMAHHLHMLPGEGYLGMRVPVVKAGPWVPFSVSAVFLETSVYQRFSLAFTNKKRMKVYILLKGGSVLVRFHKVAAGGPEADS